MTRTIKGWAFRWSNCAYDDGHWEFTAKELENDNDAESFPATLTLELPEKKVEVTRSMFDEAVAKALGDQELDENIDCDFADLLAKHLGLDESEGG